MDDDATVHELQHQFPSGSVAEPREEMVSYGMADASTGIFWMALDGFDFESTWPFITILPNLSRCQSTFGDGFDKPGHRGARRGQNAVRQYAAAHCQQGTCPIGLGGAIANGASPFAQMPTLNRLFNDTQQCSHMMKMRQTQPRQKPGLTLVEMSIVFCHCCVADGWPSLPTLHPIRNNAAALIRRCTDEIRTALDRLRHLQREAALSCTPPGSHNAPLDASYGLEAASRLQAMPQQKVSCPGKH